MNILYNFKVITYYFGSNIIFPYMIVSFINQWTLMIQLYLSRDISTYATFSRISSTRSRGGREQGILIWKGMIYRVEVCDIFAPPTRVISNYGHKSQDSYLLLVTLHLHYAMTPVNGENWERWSKKTTPI